MAGPDLRSATLLGAGGRDASVWLDVLVSRLAAARASVAEPFARCRMELIAQTSEKLLAGAEFSGYPHIKHFAFWTRRAALQRLAAGFQARLPDKTLARPRGVVFHLPPQNVETLFLYSWVLSYLAGNANVTRTPTGFGGAIRAVCERFLERLEGEGDRSQLFIHYDASGPLNAEISAQCDARVVWGGDAKVAAFAPLPLRNGGKSLWFGDRSSFCVVKGEALGGLEVEARRALAQRVYDDIFIFDQMACSSPQTLFVVGDVARDGPAASALLRDVARLAVDKGKASEAGHLMRKMVVAYQAAAGGDVTALEWRHPALTTVVSSPQARHELKVGGGFLWVDFIKSLDVLKGMSHPRDQTATHFGFRAEEVAELADAVALSGVSRLAPVGTALDFDSIWDGYDLPFELTRLVRVG